MPAGPFASSKASRWFDGAISATRFWLAGPPMRRRRVPEAGLRSVRPFGRLMNGAREAGPPVPGRGIPGWLDYFDAECHARATHDKPAYLTLKAQMALPLARCNLSGSQFRVLLALLWQTERYGRSSTERWAGTARLARDTGLSSDTVKDALKGLERKRVIALVREHGPERPKEWRVLVPREWAHGAIAGFPDGLEAGVDAHFEGQQGRGENGSQEGGGSYPDPGGESSPSGGGGAGGTPGGDSASTPGGGWAPTKERDRTQKTTENQDTSTFGFGDELPEGVEAPEVPTCEHRLGEAQKLETLWRWLSRRSEAEHDPVRLGVWSRLIECHGAEGARAIVISALVKGKRHPISEGLTRPKATFGDPRGVWVQMALADAMDLRCDGEPGWQEYHAWALAAGPPPLDGRVGSWAASEMAVKEIPQPQPPWVVVAQGSERVCWFGFAFLYWGAWQPQGGP